MHGLRDLLSIQPFIILSIFIPFSLKVHTLYQFTAFLRPHPVTESLGDFSRSIYCLLYFAFFYVYTFLLAFNHGLYSLTVFFLCVLLLAHILSSPKTNPAVTH